MPKPKKRNPRKLLIALVLVLGAGGWAAYKFSAKKDETIDVQVAKVARRDLTETVLANGRIQPVTQVMISPEVAGEIIALPVVEGQRVKKGELLLQIKPDNYEASRNSAQASYKFALGSRQQADAELAKAAMDFQRSEELAKSNLVSPDELLKFKTAYQVSKLRLENSIHQVDQARFALDKAEDDLSKTKITAPIDGTITKLKSQLGERVLGTSFNMGTEMMTIAQLDEMEARVDISEIDIVLIEEGQAVRLEVDAFKDRKFKGTVSAIANATKSSGTGLGASQAQSQDAPKFEVRIRVLDKEAFRPGMSVTAEIETRTRKQVLTVPIQSVTTRLPKLGTTPAATPKPEGKAEPFKPIEVVFVRERDAVKMAPVKTGISDNDYFEIESGLTEGQEVVSGGYKAISKDLEDGEKVTVGGQPGDKAR
jgi:HlyD family secretion protein